MTDELQAAAALTTAQLEQAIEIVEDAFGSDLENNRWRTKLEGKLQNHRYGSFSRRHGLL